jgi:hypothetical protein
MEPKNVKIKRYSMRLVKVRVYFKNPIDRKSTVMQMTEQALQWERASKAFSPYKKIVRI